MYKSHTKSEYKGEWANGKENGFGNMLFATGKLIIDQDRDTKGTLKKDFHMEKE